MEPPTQSQAIAGVEASGGDVIEFSNGTLQVSFLRTGTTDADLDCLYPLDKVTFLRLECAKITNEAFQKIASLRTLHRLSLVCCEQITDEGLSHLASLAELADLVLNNCQIGDRGLEHLAPLTRLKRLWLEGTLVTSAGLTMLTKWTSLTEVHLTGRYVTDEAALAFKKNRPDIRVCLNWLDMRVDEDLSARAKRKRERDEKICGAINKANWLMPWRWRR